MIVVESQAHLMAEHLDLEKSSVETTDLFVVYATIRRWRNQLFKNKPTQTYLGWRSLRIWLLHIMAAQYIANNVYSITKYYQSHRKYPFQPHFYSKQLCFHIIKFCNTISVWLLLLKSNPNPQHTADFDSFPRKKAISTLTLAELYTTIINPKPWSTTERFWYQNPSTVLNSIQSVLEVSALRAQIPVLRLHSSMSLHSFHLKAAAVGGFEQLWSNARWIKLISAVLAKAYGWYNESSWIFWSYFQSCLSDSADISIHMPRFRRDFDVWFPLSFEMDHDTYNRTLFSCV